MLNIKGSPALSEFRVNKLLTNLKPFGVAGLASHFIHLVDISEGLSERERQVLNSLLEYGPKMQDSALEGVKC